MTFDGQMRLGTVEIAAALLAVAVIAARPRLSAEREAGHFSPVHVVLRVVGFGSERRHEGLCPLVVGRASDTEVPLDDPEASRRHARFECRNGIVYVRDLESSNGTFLNGRRIQEAIEVRTGDEIDVGTTRLIVEDLKGWT